MGVQQVLGASGEALMETCTVYGLHARAGGGAVRASAHWVGNGVTNTDSVPQPATCTELCSGLCGQRQRGCGGSVRD